MMKTATGLHTSTHTFPLTALGRERYARSKARHARFGEITELFVANAYAFELRKFRIRYRNL